MGPALAARGPQDIVKRLKVGLEPLAEYSNSDGLLLRNGADVMYEHSETWKWDGGETASLRFVRSAWKTVSAKLSIWKDCWDLGGMTAQAPPTWLEDLAAADTSWVLDATGRI